MLLMFVYIYYTVQGFTVAEHKVSLSLSLYMHALVLKDGDVRLLLIYARLTYNSVLSGHCCRDHLP